MQLRKATPADLPAVEALYEEASQFLRAQGIDQWQDGYPNGEVFLRDVENGTSYVLEENGKVAATACLGLGREPTYDTIYRSWSGRPGTRVCPACGETPTGTTRLCSGLWRKTACPIGASSTWRTGESAWLLKRRCENWRGASRAAPIQNSISAVHISGGSCSRPFSCP